MRGEGAPGLALSSWQSAAGQVCQGQRALELASKDPGEIALVRAGSELGFITAEMKACLRT